MAANLRYGVTGPEDGVRSGFRPDPRDVAARAQKAAARVMRSRGGVIGSDPAGSPFQASASEGVSRGAVVRADGVGGASGRFAARAVADPSFQGEHPHGVVTASSAQRLARLEPGLEGAPITFTADRARHGINLHGREGIDPAPLRVGDYDRIGDLVNDPNVRVTRAPKSDRRANPILQFEDYDTKGSKIFANFEVKPTEYGPKLELLSAGMEGGARYETPLPGQRRLWPGAKSANVPRIDAIESDVPYRISPSWLDDEADPVVVTKRRFDKPGVSQRKQADMHVRSTNGLLGAHVNDETGWVLNVNRASFKGEQFNAATAEAMARIPEILQKAIRIESFDPDSYKNDTPRLHLFGTPLLVEGQPYLVRFAVNDQKRDGYKLVHKVLAIEVRKVGGPILGTQKAEQKGPRARKLSIRDFLKDYRFSDESPVVPIHPANYRP